MKRALVGVFCAMVLVMAAVIPGLAQDADVAQFIEACNTLEGAPPGACECAAEKLAGEISAEAYNGLAEAWLRGELQSPADAEPVYGTDVIDAVDNAFSACVPE